MICPACSAVTKYKEGMTCRSCGYTFVLNPKTMAVGDKRVFNAAEKLSDGQNYFTKRQLLCNCLIKSERTVGLRWKSFIIFLILGLILLFTPAMPLGIILCVISLICLAQSRKGRKNSLVKAVYQYCEKVGHPYLLTPSVTSDLLKKMEDVSFDDFYPEKTLIIEDPDYAVLLLLNNFHLENNCLILTADKKPHGSFKYLQDRLLADEPMPVFLLHDVSKNSNLYLNTITSDPSWNLSMDQITDLGLNPDELANSRIGTWYHSTSHHVQTHRNKPEFIRSMINEGWRFPVDALPLQKFKPALAYCMNHNCILLSTAMLAAMPMIYGNRPNNSDNGSSFDSSSGGDFDDFG